MADNTLHALVPTENRKWHHNINASTVVGSTTKWKSWE